MFGSAIAEMSGIARPGHGALAATPAPVCHGGPGDDVRAPAAAAAPRRRRAPRGGVARRVGARAADGDDVRAVGRVAGLVGAGVAGREVEGRPGRGAIARLFSAASRNGSAAPHSASPPKRPAVRDAVQRRVVRGVLDRLLEADVAAVAAGVREAGARRRRRWRSRRRSTSSRRASRRRGPPRCRAPSRRSSRSCCSRLPFSRMNSRWSGATVCVVHELGDGRRVARRDAVRVDRDQLVAGVGRERVHRRLALGGGPQREADRLAGAVEAVAGDVVEPAQVGREVAAAAHVDAERVDDRVVSSSPQSAPPGVEFRSAGVELRLRVEAVDVAQARDALQAEARPAPSAPSCSRRTGTGRPSCRGTS